MISLNFLGECSKSINNFSETLELKIERTKPLKEKAHQIRMKRIPLEGELESHNLLCRISEGEFNYLKSNGLTKPGDVYPPDEEQGKQLRSDISKINQELEAIDLEIDKIKEQCEQELNIRKR